MGIRFVMTTKAARQQAVEQALASAVLEGYTPTVGFFADARAVINGSITIEQARARSLERALNALEGKVRKHQ